jgi:hypothetical protein
VKRSTVLESSAIADDRCRMEESSMTDWHRMIGAAALLFLVGVAPSPARVREHRVAVGDGTVDGRFLRPYTNQWRLSYRKADGSVIDAGTTTDELVSMTIEGKACYKRTQITTYKARPVTTRVENVFDARTLAPVSLDFWMNDEHVNHRQFNGTTVTTRNREKEAKTAELDRVPYDFFGGMYGLLAAALPLRQGYVASLPAIDEESSELHDVRLETVGREQIASVGGKKVEAWVVSAETYQGPMRFWLTRTPPYVLKLTWQTPQGVVAVYEMI